MAHRIISTTELAHTLPDTLDRVQYFGDRFTIERNGQPVASLIPAQASSPITLRELAMQLADLALPGDGFADELEEIQQASQPERLPRWP